LNTSSQMKAAVSISTGTRASDQSMNSPTFLAQPT
jgi:hypothetical protein